MAGNLEAELTIETVIAGLERLAEEDADRERTHVAADHLLVEYIAQCVGDRELRRRLREAHQRVAP